MIVAGTPPTSTSLLELHCAAAGEDPTTVREEIARERERDARRYRAAAAPRNTPVYAATPSPAPDLQRFRAELLAITRTEIAGALDALRTELARDLPTTIRHLTRSTNGVHT